MFYYDCNSQLRHVGEWKWSVVSWKCGTEAEKKSQDQTCRIGKLPCGSTEVNRELDSQKRGCKVNILHNKFSLFEQFTPFLFFKNDLLAKRMEELRFHFT